MKTYTVKVAYKGKVIVTVEAEDEDQAETLGVQMADNYIAGSLFVDEIEVTEASK